MGVPINNLAVLVSAIVAMIIGALWYGPLFGKKWASLIGMTPEKMEAAKKQGMAKSYGFMFVGSLIMAYTLAHALEFASTYLGVFGVQAGLTAGFWNWLGFIAPVTMGSVLWEGKSWKLWLLNNGYYLVTLCAMGILLALWK